MEYGNYYTEETLRSLNAAYDTLYGITSRETEKVNGIIRRMEKAGRFPPVPQEGDLLEYFPQNGDYFPQAHIETIRKGQATVCLASHAPFCHTKNRKVCYSTEGGPWTRVPSAGMTPAGLATRCFQTWGRNGRCRNGEVYFHTVVRSWTFHEPNPLYGDYTMKEWTKYPVEKIPDPEKKGEYFYRCEGITLYSEKELEELAGLLQGKLFDGLHRRALVLWGYRMERIFLPATVWGIERSVFSMVGKNEQKVLKTKGFRHGRENGLNISKRFFSLHGLTSALRLRGFSSDIRGIALHRACRWG